MARTGRHAQVYGAVSVSKSFSSIRVLDQVDFEIRSGEVHALLGENGSGKSTLVKILAGVHRPDTGYVHRNGSRLSVNSPLAARLHGLTVVHQDYNLFPDLDVPTNIFGVASDPPRRWLWTVDWVRMRERAREILSKLGVRIDPRELVRDLRPADGKLIEVARALVERSSFIVFDEPTASLDRRDSETVLALVERVADQGLGVALVTHRLDEALRVADRITVLRDGRPAASGIPNKISTRSLAELIVGPQGFERSNSARENEDTVSGQIVLELAELRLFSGADPWTLRLHAGEILGLTGLAGSGAMEVAAILGGRRRLVGRLVVSGQERTIAKPSDALACGIGYVPEDRAGLGLFPDLSVETNVSLPSLASVRAGVFISRSKLRSRAEQYANTLRIRAPSLDAPVRTLSGGNQQKVLIAKCLASRVRILVLEAPTHGIDVGAKYEIGELLRQFAASGGAVLVCSTDITEVLTLANAVVVLRHGDAVGRFNTRGSTYGDILLQGTRDRQLDEIERLVQSERAEIPS